MATFPEDSAYPSIDVTDTNTLALGDPGFANFPNNQFYGFVQRDNHLSDRIDQLEGVDPEDKESNEQAAALTRASFVQGRLTLDGTTAFPTEDVTGSTLYFSNFGGDLVSIFNVTEDRWDVKQFTQPSLDISGLDANTNHDIFIFDNGGTLTLENVQWANSNAGTSARATALVNKNGIRVKSGDFRRYLGTIRIGGTLGICEDTNDRRFVWNEQKQCKRIMFKRNEGTTWTLTVGWRVADNNLDNRTEFVCGDIVLIEAINMFSTQAPAASNGAGYCAVGLDSTTTPMLTSFYTDAGGRNTEILGQVTHGLVYAAAGYHQIYALELGLSGFTQTYHGSNSPVVPDTVVGIQSSLYA